MPCSVILSLSNSKQNEFIVEILAFCKSACCFRRYLSCGCSLIISRIFLSRRFFISAAASFVKVTTIILSALTFKIGSEIICASLSVRTAVFPLPAAADTIIEEFLASIASCCCFVKFILFSLPFYP